VGGRGTGTTPLAECWNGTARSVLPSPNPDPTQNLPFAADALGPGTVWTVGMTYDGSNYRTLAMRTTNG
jgi:hypothetical protein